MIYAGSERASERARQRERVEQSSATPTAAVRHTQRAEDVVRVNLDHPHPHVQLICQRKILVVGPDRSRRRFGRDPLDVFEQAGEERVLIAVSVSEGDCRVVRPEEIGIAQRERRRSVERTTGEARVRERGSARVRERQTRTAGAAAGARCRSIAAPIQSPSRRPQSRSSSRTTIRHDT